MKHINVIIIDGKEVDMNTLPAEEKTRIRNELNRRFLEYLGYRQEETA